MTQDEDDERLEHSPVILAFKLKALEKNIEQMKARVNEVNRELFELKEERAESERRRLKAGIAALGSAVLALGGIIWWLLPANVQHAWDLLILRQRGE